MPGAVGADSPSFNAVNRGKRSIVLNLKSNEGVRFSGRRLAAYRHPNRELCRPA